MKDGKEFFPARVIGPDSATVKLHLFKKGLLPNRNLPVRVVRHVYGNRMTLPPIPTLKPRFHRRALRRVTKSLRLLDRAQDALTAHLRQLAAMRAKVQQKLETLRNEHIKRGYVLMPPPSRVSGPIPVQVKNLLRNYLMSALEVGSEAEAEAESEAEADIGPSDIVSLIEQEATVTEQPSLLETEAGAETETEAEAETVAEAEMDAQTEAETDAEAEAEVAQELMRAADEALEL